MPSDLRRVSWCAIALLVILRISIGWHLFYEGLWKLNTLKTATPWTAVGYLKNSTGPFRTMFRKMTGDENDLNWLDYDKMSAKWDAWRDRFVKHYGVDQKDVDLLLDGTGKGFSASLPELPSGFDFDAAVKSAGVAKDAIKYDGKAGQVVVDAKLHLLPTEQAKLIEVVKEEQGKADNKEPYNAVIKAINDVAKRASRLTFRERLSGMLKGDTDRTGDTVKGTVGEIEFYKDLINRYEARYSKAKTKFDWDHLERQWTELQQKRRTLVGPVQALEKDLFEEADKLLTEDQLAKGPTPDAVTEMSRINARTMWGLTILGLLLMIGLFTRLSALGGAALLSLFYLATPPWPGVQEIPSIEHNLIVNKVFVEMIALLAIALLPTGKWFGVDALVSALFRRPKAD